MKKLVLSLAIISALGLSGCDSETIADVKEDASENATTLKPYSRVVFDPSNGDLSVPNDLLFLGTQDGTLNPPVDDPTDGSDPFVALSALDGWSTATPSVIDIEFPAGVTLDGDSVFNPGSVRVFETLMGGDADPDCAEVPRGAACKVVAELGYTSDFITQKSGNSIAFIPLKPLKGKTTYLIVLTDSLLDSDGRAIKGSSTYEAVSADINEFPLAEGSSKDLQGIVNSYQNAVIAAGVDAESIIFTSAVTTQSTVDAVAATKLLLAAPLQQGGTPPIISVADTTISVAQAFTMQGIVLSPSLEALYSSANLYAGSVTLPYYLGVPTATNPTAPINTWWTSLCDSGVMLQGLAATNPEAIPPGPLSESDGVCMSAGLRDLRAAFALDTERNITKYNPIPEKKADMALEVQMTTPDTDWANAVRPSFGLPANLAEPASGWPVVILQHGITSKKEDMLAITGILSAFGFATVAIDHPIHGSRGFDLTGDGIDEINASTVSATHYMNLASLLTTRDNLRQSTSDLLGLRFGLNAVMGASIDSQNVHYLGHSLGAITGINFVAMSNTSMDNPTLDSMFNVNSNSLAMPGIMVANFLMESGAFGDVIKSNLTYAQSEDFQNYVAAVHQGNGAPTEAELVGYYRDFYALLTPEQQGELNGTFAQFTFAAQTVTDAGDPINYLSALSASQTPTHLIEVVGNGSDNLSDQVIPNTVSVAPLGGTEGAIALLGLPGVSSTAEGSGAVRFTVGHHSSILSPAPQPVAPDAEMTARATQEMQAQVAAFFLTNGAQITVTDEGVVLQP